MVPQSNNDIHDLMRASKLTLVKTASSIVDAKVGASNIIDHAVEDRIARFDPKELKLGKVLGRGGFCMAIEIDKITIPDVDTRGGSLGSNPFNLIFRRAESPREISSRTAATDPRSDHESRQNGAHGSKSATSNCHWSRDKVAVMARRRNRRVGHFVLKQVQSDGLDNYGYLKGLVDLSMEAKFLASLDHPNIISLCGMSTNGPAHFIIIERLYETLVTRFKLWVRIDRQCKGITGAITGSKKKERDLYEARMRVAYSMVSALAYLHDKQVMYRDLKPDNCGFDKNDVFKLFDFGLATELDESRHVGDGLYKHTAMTGAMRYMAPEVGLGRPYNLSADVYSWSMVMWFILALEPPFGFYTEDMIRDRVFKRGSRPAIFESWSELLGETMKLAWGSDVSARPSFNHICSVLKMELNGGSFHDSTKAATDTSSAM